MFSSNMSMHIIAWKKHGKWVAKRYTEWKRFFLTHKLHFRHLGGTSTHKVLHLVSSINRRRNRADRVGLCVAWAKTVVCRPTANYVITDVPHAWKSSTFQAHCAMETAEYNLSYICQSMCINHVIANKALVHRHAQSHGQYDGSVNVEKVICARNLCERACSPISFVNFKFVFVAAWIIGIYSNQNCSRSIPHTPCPLSMSHPPLRSHSTRMATLFLYLHFPSIRLCSST